MAAITAFTTSAVIPDESTLGAIGKYQLFRAHEVIDAGEPVYRLTSTYPDGVALTDADAIASSRCIGIAVNTAAAAGQFVNVMTYGLLTVGGTQTVGADVYIHGTAGALTITPADLASGDFATIVGM